MATRYSARGLISKMRIVDARPPVAVREPLPPREGHLHHCAQSDSGGCRTTAPRNELARPVSLCPYHSVPWCDTVCNQIATPSQLVLQRQLRYGETPASAPGSSSGADQGALDFPGSSEGDWREGPCIHTANVETNSGARVVSWS